MKQYIIRAKDEVTEAIVDLCSETSLTTLRPSVDQLDVLLKYEGPTPEVFKDDTKYNETEIIEILESAAWTEPPEAVDNE
tara:strand:+ start:289 stop:528 length:240 start_codon:yes stop_codon:yes gene_type:complete